MVTIRFYLLKKAKNILDAKNNNFHFFCVIKVLQCTCTYCNTNDSRSIKNDREKKIKTKILRERRNRYGTVIRHLASSSELNRLLNIESYGFYTGLLQILGKLVYI